MVLPDTLHSLNHSSGIFSCSLGWIRGLPSPEPLELLNFVKALVSVGVVARPLVRSGQLLVFEESVSIIMIATQVNTEERFALFDALSLQCHESTAQVHTGEPKEHQIRIASCESGQILAERLLVNSQGLLFRTLI